MAAQSGSKTIEEVLAPDEQGLTIEDVLGPPPAVNVPNVGRSARQPLANPNLVTKGDMDRQLLQGSAAMIGTLAGGIPGRLVGEALAGAAAPAMEGLPWGLRFLPPLVRHGLPVAGAATGEGVGGGLGMVATGVPPEEAAKAAFTTAMMGGGTEFVGRIGSRGLATAGGISPEATQEAMGRPFWKSGEVMYGRPAGRAELELGDRLAGQLRPPPDTSPIGAVNLTETTPARYGAETKMRRFDRASPVKVTPPPKVPTPVIDEYGPGAGYAPAPGQATVSGGIDTYPIRQKILNMVKPASLEENQQRLNDYLIHKANSMPERMSAGDLDEFIREHRQPAAGQIGAEKVSPPAQVRLGIVAAAKEARDAALPQARHDFAQASRQLKAMRAVTSRTMTKTGDISDAGVARLRNILADPITDRLLARYEQQTGNVGVRQEARDLAARREWTRPIQGKGWAMVMDALRHLIRPFAKAGIVGSPIAGQAVAAGTAYSASQKEPK